MTIEITTQEHTIRIIVLALNGRLDAFEAPALRKVCDDYLAQQVNHIVFDLTEVSMLDSAGPGRAGQHAQTYAPRQRRCAPDLAARRSRRTHPETHQVRPGLSIHRTIPDRPQGF